MARIKLNLPDQSIFQTIIPVRITDLNYGGHVGNDTVLSIVHEARVQFLLQYGYSELNIEGQSLIMADVGIEYKAELFYGDILQVKLFIADLSRVGFDLYYKLEKKTETGFTIVAVAKTGLLFFDYNARKVVSMPEPFKTKFSALPL